MHRLPQGTEAVPSSAASIPRISVQHTRPSQPRQGRMPVVYQPELKLRNINILASYIGTAYARSNNTGAAIGAGCAANRMTSARPVVRAPSVRGVWRKKLRMESDGRFRPAHRHGPGWPLLQRVGARAAIERDDRTAISERVPCGLPRTRGNRSRGAVQARRDIPHTARILEAVRGTHVPVTQEERRHTFPTAAGSGTHVPALLEEPHGALRAGARATASRVPAQACGMRIHVPGQQRRWM